MRLGYSLLFRNSGLSRRWKAEQCCGKGEGGSAHGLSPALFSVQKNPVELEISLERTSTTLFYVLLFRSGVLCCRNLIT